jgi:hypothetical protein
MKKIKVRAKSLSHFILNFFPLDSRIQTTHCMKTHFRKIHCTTHCREAKGRRGAETGKVAQMGAQMRLNLPLVATTTELRAQSAIW